MPDKAIYDVKDVEKILKCKKSKAYSVIKELNNELSSLGSKITVGKIPAQFFHNRYKGFLEERR